MLRHTIIFMVLIGMASAGWYPASQNMTTTGDVNAADGVFSGSLSVTGLVTAGGDISASDDTDLGDSLDVGGSTRTNGLTVNSSQTLAVTSADRLTVGGKIIPQELVVVWPMSASSVDESVFIPTGNYNVTAVEIRYSVAASSGPTNVTLRKCTVTEAPATGDAITSAMNLATTTNTVGSYTPIVNMQSITSADTLCLDYTGTMTALAGGTVTITLQRT